MEIQVRFSNGGNAKDVNVVKDRFGKPVYEQPMEEWGWVLGYNREPSEARTMLDWLLDDRHLPSVMGLYVVR